MAAGPNISEPTEAESGKLVAHSTPESTADLNIL